MKTKNVIVVPYDSIWKLAFQQISDELTTLLADLILGIEHVGSTSVKGLAAKPIIDIDIIVSDESMLDKVISKLESHGYTYEGDLGITGREAFSYKNKEHLHKHHLYVCTKNSIELNKHLVFRNYLKLHPHAVKEYSAIKFKAAKLFPNDIDSYMNYKSNFIKDIYKICKLI